MEGPEKSTKPGDNRPPRSSRWVDWLIILVLLVLAGMVRVWLIGHTEVTARDGVGYMRYAWQLQTQEWPHVLRENPHPPLYPLTILAMSYPVRLLVSGSNTFLLQLSAQLTTALAGMLLVVPMYFLGRELFDRRVGFWAALLFQCLPAGSRVLSDALSEGIFLLLAATAFWLALRAVQGGSPIRFGLIGLCSGLAYLTRPEGMLLGVAPAAVLVGLQAWPPRRWPWRRVFVCGMSLALPALAVTIPYMAVIGHFTNKNTALRVLQAALPVENKEDPRLVGRIFNPSKWRDGLKIRPTWRDGLKIRPTSGFFRGQQTAPPLLASLWAIWGPDSKEYGFIGRQVWCLESIAREIMRGFYYVAWLPALWGLYRHVGRLRGVPGVWVMLLTVVLDGLVLWRVAYVVGYVAERHTLLMVMTGMPWAVAGTVDLGQHLAAFWSRRSVGLARFSFGSRCRLIFQSGSILSGLMLTGLAVSGLPKTLEPLHTNRAGYHAAGLWLAANAQPDDQIMDPFCWAEYYAGQVFRRPAYDYDLSRVPRYVVLGGSKNEHERLPLIPFANEYARKGTVVYHWCPRPSRQKAEEVVVYRIAAPADAH